MKLLLTALLLGTQVPDQANFMTSVRAIVRSIDKGSDRELAKYTRGNIWAISSEIEARLGKGKVSEARLLDLMRNCLSQDSNYNFITTPEGYKVATIDFQCAGRNSPVLQSFDDGFRLYIGFGSDGYQIVVGGTAFPRQHSAIEPTAKKHSGV